MDKFALVMGASGDIGSAIAEKLAADGWSLYLHYHQQYKKITALQQKLSNNYPTQIFQIEQLDMRDTSNLKNFIQNIFQLEAIIFASGHSVYKLLTEMSEEEMQNLWQVHLGTPILLLQQLQDKLSVSKHGRIIFIGSVYGRKGSAMEVVYSTVKGAMDSFANAYSKEVASLGITVNVVAPGAVATEMTAKFSAAEKQNLIAEIPMERMAIPSDIAFPVVQICKPESQYLTGETIYVTGGW